MKTKKQIDRLFTEQFKDFEVAPPPSAWENISAVLKKNKKEKRVLPFYYRMAGIAALLLAIFSIRALLMETPPVPLTNTEVENKILPRNESPVVYQGDEGKIIEWNEFRAPEKMEGTDNTESARSASVKIADLNSKEVLKAEEKWKNAEIGKQQENRGLISGTADAKKESSMAVVGKEEIVLTPSSELGKFSETENTANTSSVTEVVSEEPKESAPENKKSLLETVSEQQEALAVSEEDKSKSPWGVSTNFAPVYYNTIGKGSSIDPQFSDNPKSGDVNLSYGVQVSYAFNDKLSVRTGVQKVNLRYATGDVDFGVSHPSAALKSINYNSRGYIIAVGASGTLAPQAAALPTSDDGYPIVIPRSGVRSGSLSQQLDYLEVPLELSYTLLNSRIGIHLIGGLSTLFLGTNEISVNSDGFETVIGEANNLNAVSFSSNLGLGFNYKISRQLLFNVEPIFKYQLNPYSDSSVDFKPYYLGVHSGFSYRF